jgi:penicillin-binding protein 1A
MFCVTEGQLRRQVAEFRTAVDLERRYSRRQLFSRFANRVPLGSGRTGIAQRSEFYFRKNPAELDLSEAALLTGLIKGPSYDSPIKPADHALRRRNEVLDAMIENGSIRVDGENAKAADLDISTK